MTPPPVIRFNDVSVRASASRTTGRAFALENVNFSIAAGEFVCVLGPNGAGKSTLLKAVNGLIGVSSGDVEVFGVSLRAASGLSVRKAIGYVPQELSVTPHLPITVSESVLVGTYGQVGFFRSPSKQILIELKELLQSFNLAHLAKKPLGQLSGGELQKTALARAVLQRPRILLLDEPATSLDLSSQLELREMIGRLHEERSLTTLLVTHDLNGIPKQCSRVIFVDQGKLRWQGAATEIFDEQLASALLGTRIRVFEDENRRYVCI